MLGKEKSELHLSERETLVLSHTHTLLVMCVHLISPFVYLYYSGTFESVCMCVYIDCTIAYLK